MVIAQRFIFIGIPAAALFLWIAAGTAAGAHLDFRPQSDTARGRVSLYIDHAEKIAGLKVTIDYDKALLRFVNAAKATATASFMHVVNSKTPGRLIIVMANARGISGEQVALLDLEFVKTRDSGKASGKIAVTQVQLMDEDLREIPADHPEYLF